ncbi:hypothetical protein B9Z19DRAFT_1121397 [Tuber borchii]|uniref:Atos-like conserved domain-containing protein n=1 Tax=Tuber borchii TaxID=42251 RepID=A0A2T7A2M8_TUBBO|nr:hypothetical protein B9Z19DRAFT_1121397 [Tuber borchii]
MPMPLVYNTEHPSPPQSSPIILEEVRRLSPPRAPQLAMHTKDLNSTASPSSPSLSPTTTTTVNGVTDRAELIERIKAGQTPTWIPNRSHSNYYPKHSPSETHFIDEHPDRPQSALHQGVFTGNESRNFQPYPASPTFPSASPFLGSPSTGYNETSPLTTASPFNPYASELYQARARHGGLSFSSNFVLKAPTSPLVHSSNPDHDSSSSEGSPTSTAAGAIDIEYSFPGRQGRRISLPPSSLSSLQLSPTTPSLLRRPRGTGWGDGRSTSPPPTARHVRRFSGFGGSASDLPFGGSLVGSFEESILNGRMSTTPSKPLNFVAQIGVLGLGKCKPSLRCPTHVTLPFPAYFYALGDYDSPSPYVGQIDLDTALNTANGKSSKAPPGVGGAYRIPQRGQLQIVIKNPNKTAVKLFLVPYDLRDMEAGSKTFIRQKSYSVGNPLLSDFAGNIPVAMKRGKEKDSLRYLIHLHICSPSRGRYYLHKSIRVVFANRVPDGKEKLRNELLWPEPKFSPWKPESCAPMPISSLANRKRSTSLHMGFTSALDSGAKGAMSPPPIPKFSGANADPVCMKGMSIDSASEMDSDVGEYEKMSVSSSIGRAEGQGLLAKKLKGLEVLTTDGLSTSIRGMWDMKN